MPQAGPTDRAKMYEQTFMEKEDIAWSQNISPKTFSNYIGKKIVTLQRKSWKTPPWSNNHGQYNQEYS